MKKDTTVLICGIIVLCICVSTLSFLTGKYAGMDKCQQFSKQIDRSWFDGVWFNAFDNPGYSSASIQLVFFNMFDDVIIYHETYINETKTWSHPDIGQFHIFLDQTDTNNFKNYVLYFETPLELGEEDDGVYVATVWDGTDDMFEIYYGNGQCMRFYKAKT